MSFEMLGLAEPIARVVAEERYTEPTPIQAAAVPAILSGRDVIGIAQTGTGKTAAFALPILHHLATRAVPAEAKHCRVLVLTPTRELAGQIADSFRTYGRRLRVSVALAIGGVPMGKQVRALAGGVDVLVATPGRLLDLVDSRALRLDRTECLVLDEADRMLDMGFIHDVRKIAALVPRQRQTLLFSATMAPEITRLAGAILSHPVTLTVTPSASTVDRISQRAVHVARADKPALLARILTTETIDRALVFARTKHGADRVVRDLQRAGIDAEALHGNKSQGQRQRTLAAFRDGRVRTLVATDIAARGIDVDGISHVINYDLPNIPESYVHRIGRTARAGNSGIAISFCSGEERALLRDIEKLIRQQIPAEFDNEKRSLPAAAAASRQGRKPRPEGKKQSRRRQRQDSRPRRHPDRPSRAPHTGDDIGGVAFMMRPAAVRVEKTT